MTVSTLILVADTPDAARMIGDFLSDRFPADKLHIANHDTAGLITLIEHCPGQEMPKLVLFVAGPREDQIIENLRLIRAHPRGRLIPLVLLQAGAAAIDAGTAARLGVNSCVRLAEDTARREHDLDQLVRYWIDLNIPPPCAASAA